MKIKVEFDLDFDGLEDLSDEDKFYAIEEIVELGADKKYASVNIKAIEFKNE